MGETGRIDIDNFISYSNDLIQVLNNNKDANSLVHCFQGMEKLHSFSTADFNHLQIMLQECQKKLDTSKQRIEEAKRRVLNDEDLGKLESELEEELQKEHSLTGKLRIVNGQISDLEHQRLSVKDQKKTLIKCKEDELKAQNKLLAELSSYASVTSIVPYLHDKTKVSGQIVGRDSTVFKKFEFEQTASFEICNNLWEMIDI